MPKRHSVFILFLAVGLLFTSLVYAQDLDSAANELGEELERETGLTKSERRAIHGQTKEMLSRGASKEEIKNAVSDLKKEGIEGKELEGSVESMGEMVKKGKKAKEAGNIVSKAAHQARQEGLKGKDLANRVHEAVRKMQEEKRHEREAVREEKRKSHMEYHKHEKGAGHRGGLGGAGRGRAR